MRSWLAALRRIGGLFTPDRARRDFDDELESHLQLHVDELVRSGSTPAEARRQALAKLGGRQQARERYRDRRGLPFFDQVLQDARFGVRLFVRNPGFSLLSIVALTVGLGVNILVFSQGYLILTTPLPGVDPDRLVRVYASASEDANVRFVDYLDYRDRNRTLTGLAATKVEGFSLRTNEGTDHALGLVVSGDYFGLLGIGAAVGRTLTPADDRPDSAGVVMLSHGAWTERFGADPGIVGRTLAINGRPLPVVGVTPQQFPGTALPAVPEIYVTWHGSALRPSANELARGAGRSVQLIGRLKPGIELPQAEADLSAIASDLAVTFPERGAAPVGVFEGHMVGPTLRDRATAFLAVLLSLTVLVLGVTAINLAALQLARGTARRQEIDVRWALGAGRARLVRQLLTENLVLAAVACLSAFGFVLGGARLLTLWSATMPGGMTLTVAPHIGWQAVAFAIVLSLCTTVLIGLLPALRSSRLTASSLAAMRASGAARVRGRVVLISAQTAFSTLLVILAAVLLRSLGEAQEIDRGFSTERILSASLDIDERRYSAEEGADFYARLIEAAEQAPGVVSASLVEIVPLTMSNRGRLVLREGQAPPAPTERGTVGVSTNNIAPGYLEVVGIPLLAGRDFSWRDASNAPEVAIVNETFARRSWPNENPIGQRFRTWDGLQSLGPWTEVVGLARDSKYTTVGEDPRPFFYRPLAQVFVSQVNILVKTSASEPLTVLPTLRAAVQAFDPHLAIFAADTLERQTRLSLLPVQATAALASCLGAVALILTAIGIYGVTAQLVRQRAREASIRIALGAEPQGVVRLLVRQGLKWAVLGLVVGLAGAAASTRLLASLLYGVSALDPIAFVSVTALVSAMAYLACWWPARQVVRADPAITLRAE
jgi:predicted permease